MWPVNHRVWHYCFITDDAVRLEVSNAPPSTHISFYVLCLFVCCEVHVWVRVCVCLCCERKRSMSGVFSAILHLTQTDRPMSIRVLPVSTSTMLGFQWHTHARNQKHVFQKTLYELSRAISPASTYISSNVYVTLKVFLCVWRQILCVVITVLFLVVICDSIPLCGSHQSCRASPPISAFSVRGLQLCTTMAGLRLFCPFFSMFPVQFLMDV